MTAWYYNWIFSGKDKQAKKDAYEKLLKTDPIEANRRFKAIVPPNIFGFFVPHQHKIQECVNPNLISPVQYKTTTTRRRATVKGVLKDIDFTALELYKIKGDNKERHWGGDFSLSKDSLVLVSGYAEKLDRDVEEFSYKIYEKESGRPIDKLVTISSKPIIDTILVWKPLKGHPVDYQNVEDVILDLLGNSYPNSKSLHFDKWNTESIRQKLLDIGISDCETLPFGNPQQVLYGRVLRHLVWQNSIEYLDNTTLLNEMNKLMLLNNAKIDHPDGGCFTGDTRVSLLDGTEPTFEELHKRYGDGSPFYVYSINDNGVCVGTARNPRITKKQVEIVEVMIDNHQIIRCTPDHLFMTVSKEWVRAENLTPEISLMPLYRTTSIRGGWADYERFYCPVQRQRYLTHRMVANQFHGEVGDGVAHHIDEDKMNNVPTNVNIKTRTEHNRYHTSKRHSEDKEWVQKLRAGHKIYRENGGNEISRANILNLYDTGKLKRCPEICVIEGCTNKARSKDLCENHYRKMRRVHNKAINHNGNHRALRVRKLTEIVDVWDITVDTGNFALNSGVFVHNSKDIWDAISICTYNIIMKTSAGSRLDIGMEIENMEKLQDDQEQELVQLYQQAYKLYLKRKNHPPKSEEDMRDFLIKEMNYRCTVDDVVYMRELWYEWAEDLNNRVLGFEKYREFQSDSIGDPMGTDKAILRELEDQEDGIMGGY